MHQQVFRRIAIDDDHLLHDDRLPPYRNDHSLDSRASIAERTKFREYERLASGSARERTRKSRSDQRFHKKGATLGTKRARNRATRTPSFDLGAHFYLTIDTRNTEFA